VILRSDEQRLGAHHTAANSRTRPSGLDALADPGDDRRPAGDDQRLPESRRDSGPRARTAERIKPKPAISPPEVSTDLTANPAISAEVCTGADGAKPATRAEVTPTRAWCRARAVRRVRARASRIES
jgi:hypothetical protein